MQSLENIIHAEQELIEKYLEDIFQEKAHLNSSEQRLLASVNYSLLGKGKRFRPALTLLMEQILSGSTSQSLPFAAAVEMVHTYSLIHDDLPCMDDDTERRGEPTNHVIYGEAIALLAGDALLTEAFGHMALSPLPEVIKIQLIQKLHEAAGIHGMIAGQAADIEAQRLSAEELLKIQKLKTGKLISVALEGAAIICQAPEKTQDLVRNLGDTLGLAFQVADDLQDYNNNPHEICNWVPVIGLSSTENMLEELTQKALQLCKALPDSPHRKKLQDIILFNLHRIPPSLSKKPSLPHEKTSKT
ncbi:MAG: polyprenyl synthetase family protein [Bdellovibrio sp.]|nr:MAG: polyprenyl synthetase family protein [Bdellovibrio sp.]